MVAQFHPGTLAAACACPEPQRRGFRGSDGLVREPFDFVLWLLRRRLLRNCLPSCGQPCLALAVGELFLLFENLRCCRMCFRTGLVITLWLFDCRAHCCAAARGCRYFSLLALRIG